MKTLSNHKYPLSTIVLTLILSAGGCSFHKTTAPLITTEPKDGPPKEYQDISTIPDAIPIDEPRARYGNHSPYHVLGKTYHVMKSAEGYKEDGIGSWYGEKFAGRKTSSFEPYDPYAMTAAHKSLPLPTYVRVTNLENNREIIVKVNDRGPFHDGRIIDLSYAAAAKLGYMNKGTAQVRVEAIIPPKPNLGAPLLPETENTVVTPLLPPTPYTVESSASENRKDIVTRPDSTSKSENTDDIASDTGQSSATANTQHADAPPAPTEPQIYLQVAAFSQLSAAQDLEKKLTPNLSAPVAINSSGDPHTQMHRVRVGPFKDEMSAILVSEQIKLQKMGDPLIIHR